MTAARQPERRHPRGVGRAWADLPLRSKGLVVVAIPLLGWLFVPFERVAREQSAIEGTGLGLPLSKRLAEAMGGTLDLESIPQPGSTFWVELPLVEGPVQQDERARPDEPAPVEEEPEPAEPTLT